MLGMDFPFDQTAGTDAYQAVFGDQIALQAAIQLYCAFNAQVPCQHSARSDNAGLAIELLQIRVRFFLTPSHYFFSSIQL
ncbi:hypothetical protein D3C77_728800 [compost metagenome]